MQVFENRAATVVWVASWIVALAVIVAVLVNVRREERESIVAHHWLGSGWLCSGSVVHSSGHCYRYNPCTVACVLGAHARVQGQ